MRVDNSSLREASPQQKKPQQLPLSTSHFQLGFCGKWQDVDDSFKTKEKTIPHTAVLRTKNLQKEAGDEVTLAAFRAVKESSIVQSVQNQFELSLGSAFSWCSQTTGTGEHRQEGWAVYFPN